MEGGQRPRGEIYIIRAAKKKKVAEKSVQYRRIKNNIRMITILECNKTNKKQHIYTKQEIK